MEIKRDDLLLKTIDKFTVWLINTKLYSYDPCDLSCSNTLYRVEKIKEKCEHILLPQFLSNYSVYSIENKIPRLSRILTRKTKASISSALFADGLLNMHEVFPEKEKPIKYAMKELDWLVRNRCMRYRGYSWGLPFDWRMGISNNSDGVLASSGTPFSTLSIYPVSAFKHAEYCNILPDNYKNVVKESKYLFTNYLKKRKLSPNSISLSYSPIDDFYIVNVNSYAAATLCLIDDEYELIKQLLQYVLDEQNKDGSWNYWGKVEESRTPSVDSLHHSYILQNLIICYNKLNDANIRKSIESGLDFFVSNFIEDGLVRKFPQSYKDIYFEESEVIDIAEALNLFIDASKIFPKYLDWVDVLFASIMGAYSIKDKKYFKTKLNPRTGVDIPFIRWGQSQLYYSLTKYYKMLNEK